MTDYKALYEKQLAENTPHALFITLLSERLKAVKCCDFCDKERKVLTKRDAGYDEWTCATCHKEQYPEMYESDSESESESESESK